MYVLNIHQIQIYIYFIQTLFSAFGHIQSGRIECNRNTLSAAAPPPHMPCHNIERYCYLPNIITDKYVPLTGGGDSDGMMIVEQKECTN